MRKKNALPSLKHCWVVKSKCTKLANSTSKAGELASVLLGSLTKPSHDEVKQVYQHLKESFLTFKEDTEVRQMMSKAELLKAEGEAKGEAKGEARWRAEEHAKLQPILEEKNKLLNEKEHQLSEKDSLLSEQEHQLNEKEKLLNEKNNQLGEQKYLLDEKNNQLNEQEKRIAELEALLNGQK